MTPAKAKVIFSTHMQAARTRKLTQYELNQLSKARQVLRQQHKPVMNKPRQTIEAQHADVFIHNKKSRSKSNPVGVLIYGQVDTIYAKKTQDHICDDECKAHGHRYYHKFSSKPKMYGLPDGTLLIKP